MLSMLPLAAIAFLYGPHKLVDLNTFLIGVEDVLTDTGRHEKVIANIERALMDTEKMVDEEAIVLQRRLAKHKADLRKLAVVPPMLTERRRTCMARTLYFVSFFILVAYALNVQLLQLLLGEEGQGFPASERSMGWVFAGSCVFLDIVMMLYFRAGLASDPTTLVMMFAVLRCLLVSCGPHFWFVGQSIAFAVLMQHLLLSVTFAAYEEAWKRRIRSETGAGEEEGANDSMLVSQHGEDSEMSAYEADQTHMASNPTRR